MKVFLSFHSNCFWLAQISNSFWFYPPFLIRITPLLSIRPPSWKYPVSEEHEPFSSQHATVSAGLLVDTNLDTSVPDTYRAPPAPIPYETYAGHPPTLSGNHESSGNKSEVVLQSSNAESVDDVDSGSALETKVKDLEVDEKAKMDIELVASKKVDDENADDIKKSIEPMVTPLQDEEDVCPTCLEEYDAENPKIITKCDHHFHLACILEWMERSDTCPVCDQVRHCYNFCNRQGNGFQSSCRSLANGLLLLFLCQL